jgi:hypothetical protein
MTGPARLAPFLDWAFWLWAVVGALIAVSTFSLGPLIGLPVIVIAVLMGRHPRLRPAWLGALVGFGALLLYVAYLQREGPGVTCWEKGTAAGCDEHLDPRPWLVAGIIFVAAGLAAQAWRSREA